MHISSLRAVAVGAATLGVMFGTPFASANESGDWLVRAGGSLIQPKSDNGSLDIGPGAPVSVDSQWGFTFNVSYFFTPNVAVELLGAYPFQHDFTVSVGNARVDGHVDQLPPTLSVQYHFVPDGRIRPYVGVGLNYTMFDNAHLDAPVNVRFDDSMGLALDGGIDFAINEHWLVNLDFRYIHLTTDTHVAGSDVGNVDIDPFVYGINVGYRF
ncbi:MAG TPA: OmpW family outer membrane protein [Pseudomonadales bacterium]|nr:OmpW family outer membrane protein [Pseudomonadales bacterium]